MYPVDSMFERKGSIMSRRRPTARFFILLVAYGGKCYRCEPKIIKPFDKTNMQQYRLGFWEHEDGYHLSGYIYDQNDDTIAYI